MKKLEQGIPFDPIILLARKAGDSQQSAHQQKSFEEFETLISQRKTKVEHSILNRINCHKDKFDELFKNYNPGFQDKNRYPDMLPFNFNRVKLSKEIRPF